MNSQKMEVPQDVAEQIRQAIDELYLQGCEEAIQRNPKLKRKIEAEKKRFFKQSKNG